MKKYLLLTYIAVLNCLFALAGSPVFGTDVVIKDTTGVNQSSVKLTTAFNGWQYAAFSTVSGGIKGGITIRVSKDGGSTWQTIDSYSNTGTLYPSLDVVVAGTDTGNLTLYNAAIRQDLSGNTDYVLFVDAYNATSGAYIGRKVSFLDSMQIYNVAIASDYANPSSVSNPYSVGVLYSAHSSYADSVIFIGSTDGGATWTVNQNITTTTNYFGQVSLAYGISQSASNGRYFGAWEMVSEIGNLNGDIYTSHSTTTVDGAWNSPVNIDSLSSATSNTCRNPSVAVSMGTTDNDSGAVTAVVLFDYDVSGNGTNYDMGGFYNKVAHFSDYWFPLTIMTGTENDMQPSIVYCISKSTFFCTYFDSTDGYLPYVQNDINLSTPNTWTFITTWYNDRTTGLTAPYPQVSANEMGGTGSFAWIQNNGTNDQALHDQEGSTVSVPEESNAMNAIVLYPNPAPHEINVSVSLKSSSHILINIYNALGQTMLAQDLGTLEEGNSNHLINIEGLANGNYLVKVTGDRFLETEKLVIAR